MVPSTIPGSDESSSTLASFNMKGDVLVQVTSHEVFDCSTYVIALGHVWYPPSGVLVSVVSGNATQLLIGATGGHLILSQVDADKKMLTEVSRTQLYREVSCVNCNPLQTPAHVSDSDEMGTPDTPFMAVVGVWAEVNETPIVKLLALPSFSVISTVELGGDAMARCVLLSTMEEHHYLLIALGDGHLLIYSVNADVASAAAKGIGMQLSWPSQSIEIVSERRKLSIGTQPANLNDGVGNGIRD